MNGITKTIPAKAGIETIDSFYDGSIKKYEFHMAGNPNPSKLQVGDYVYTIYGDQLYGRLLITNITGGSSHPTSGRPRTLIDVQAPGERLTKPIPRKSHRGTRYFDGIGWATKE